MLLTNIDCLFSDVDKLTCMKGHGIGENINDAGLDYEFPRNVIPTFSTVL